MKFHSISQLLQFFNRQRNIEESRSNENIDKVEGKTVAANQSVVRFEDCERINRERFAIIENRARIKTNNQYYAALSANILALSVGASIGWTSPGLQILQSPAESPLNSQITLYQSSLISSLLPLGAMFGTIFYGFLSEFFGRFWSLFTTALPQILSWLIIVLATEVEHLYLARFLCGIATGGVFALVPLYVSEISDINIRGSLSSIFLLSINAGTLLMFIAGFYIDYSLVSKLMLCVPIIFAITFLFFPETPYYLLKCNKHKSAENALRFFRGCENLNETPENVKSELLNIAKKVEEDGSSKKISIFGELSSPSSKKALIIGIVLVIVNQFCGVFAFLNYTSEIFADSGSSLSSSSSAILIAFIQLLGSIMSTLITEKMTRKFLYVSTCLGVIIGLLIFGVHGMIKSIYETVQFNWVPVTSMSMVIFIASVGPMPLTFTIISEILPLKIRSFGISICTTILWLIAFLLLQFFPIAVNALQLFVCMFIFCFITFIGMVFLLVYLPETKNKSADEIELLLGNLN